MYFLPRHNRFYRTIVYIKPLHRYAITLIASIAFVGIWYLGVHSMLVSNINHAQAEIKRLRQQEALIKQSVADSLQLEKSIAALQGTLQNYINKKAENSFHSAMMALINEAGMCGLAMQTCAADELKDENWYTRNTINVDVSGSFEQLLKFVQSLSSTNHIMAMHHATLARIPTVNKFNFKCSIDVIAIK